MHNFRELYSSLYVYNKNWRDYSQLNQNLANKILEVKDKLYPELKTIWIHSDNLLMVPYYVKRKFVEANIGFFFHSAFPSSNVYRSFHRRLDILHSLLTCDLIGFHLYEFARNFMNVCHRILGLSPSFKRGDG